MAALRQPPVTFVLRVSFLVYLTLYIFEPQATGLIIGRMLVRGFNDGAPVSKQFNIIYFGELKQLPASKEQAPSLALVSLFEYDPCERFPTFYREKAVLIQQTNRCSMEILVMNFRAHETAALLIINDFPRTLQDTIDLSRFTQTPEMIVAYIAENTAFHLIAYLATGTVNVSMFAC